MTGFEREHRQAERLVIVGGVDATQIHERVVRNRQRLAKRSEMLVDETRRKQSCPAGTGVCVVNTTWGETRRIASQASTPSVIMRCRTSSSAANAL